MSDTSNPIGSQSLNIGTIISESFSLTFKNFIQLLVIMIVPIIVVAAVNYLLLGPMFQNALGGLGNLSGPQPAPEFGATDIVMMIAAMLLMILTYSFLYAACISAFFDAKSGRGVNIGRALSTGISRAVQLFVSTLVLGILVSIVFGIISVVLGFIAAALGAIGGVLVMIVTVALMLYMYGLLLPFPAAVVVENMWLGAIGRSMELSKGYRWWLVLMLFLFGLAVMVLYAVLIGIFYVLAQLGTVGMIIVAVIGVLFMVVMSGAAIGVLTLAYARLREIKEGTSIGSLAQIFD